MSVFFEVAWVDDSDGTAEPAVSSPGFNSASSSTATRRGRGSRTVYFNPAYSSASNVDHWVTTNWEKWQSDSNSREWAYNRYATFDPANGTHVGWGFFSIGQIVDATIRSRPWSGEKDRLVGGPFDYIPDPEEQCNTLAKLDIKVGGNASLSVPLVNCYSSLEIYPNGNQHSMGAAWYGKSKAQKKLDFAFDFESNGETPIMADYVYMGVNHCYSMFPFDTCPGGADANYKWTDSGW
jgi:hypothetical protein